MDVMKLLQMSRSLRGFTQPLQHIRLMADTTYNELQSEGYPISEVIDVLPHVRVFRFNLAQAGVEVEAVIGDVIAYANNGDVGEEFWVANKLDQAFWFTPTEPVKTVNVSGELKL